MAKTQILWTALPFGRSPADGPGAGRWRVSLAVSPRLTPEAEDEQVLAAFPDWLDWPGTLARAKIRLRIGADEVGLAPLGAPDGGLWGKLLPPGTPVSGFVYKDMSRVRLRSFPVRTTLGMLRRHYGRLAVQAAGDHPRLLPWREAHGDLKGMLTELGTRTQKINFGDRSIELMAPGFERFFEPEAERAIDAQAFGGRGGPVREIPSPFAEEDGPPAVAEARPLEVMPADWFDPAAAGGARGAGLMALFPGGASEYALWQASRFYRREVPSDAEREMRRPSQADIPAPPKAPDYDVHRILASFGAYPELLRRLGLVLDFALEDDAVLDDRIAQGGGAAAGRVQAVLDWDGAPGEDVTPFTAFIAGDGRFLPRPRSRLHRGGLLRLERSDDRMSPERRGIFDVTQVDPDGAAMKTVNFTLTAQRLLGRHLSLKQKHGEVTYTTGDRQGVAALRSGGLGVSQHGRAEELAVEAAAGALKQGAVGAGSGSAMTLFAEDVMRGYRVDVAAVPDAATPGRWRTLCARVGDYRIAASGEEIALPPDEGHVSGASTTSAAAASAADPDDHYLHETLFRWTGWSLVAPRPGRALKAEAAEGGALQAEVPVSPEDAVQAEGGNGVRAQFRAAPGTLPRLRFGQLYRVRARLVDLAGNGLALEDPSVDELEAASEAVGYWRFEPVDPPALVQRARLSEGEQLERLVIRSNWDVDAANYLGTEPFASAAAGPASADFAYAPQNERHVVPPKASQILCETHGLFDPFFGDWEAARKGYEIAAREAGTLFDGGPGAEVELVTPAALAGVATTAAVPPELPSPENPVGDRLAGGQYVIHKEARLRVPYLPDGASGGVAIRAARGHVLPGIAAEMDLGPSCVVRFTPAQELAILVRHGGGWPDLEGFRLILAEREASVQSLPCAETFAGDGAPVWDEDARTLTLFVAKGRIHRMVYASFVEPAALPALGIPRWTEGVAEAEFALKTAAMGANWLMTPFRELALVHAVQAPVCEPELEVLSPNRDPGSQEARLLCRRVRLHGPSTGKLEIEAAWHEWVDDPARPGPERRAFDGRLSEVRLAENHRNEFVLQDAVDADAPPPPAPNAPPGTSARARGDVHVFGDSRFRLVAYRARVTTRFREYLPPAVYADAAAVTRLGPVAEGPAFALPPEDDPGAPVLPATGGSTAQSLVPASAPPAAPRLLYVVPTFRWQRGAAGHDVTRHGNGLRVWLDRPWFSSGDGELLGVVLMGDGARFTDIPERFQTLVTQWGTDPFWDSALPKSLTRASDFPARVATEEVRLQEQPFAADPFVTIVGHRVHFDAGRRLWYADVELDPGASYMPFVRLALVRYQPNALAQMQRGIGAQTYLAGAKVSKVVLADFAQVLPRRRAVVTVGPERVAVRLHGPSPAFGPMKFPVDSEFQDVSFIQGVHETGRNRVELVLQTQEEGLESDLGWRDARVLHSAVVGGESTSGPVFPGLVAPQEERGPALGGIAAGGLVAERVGGGALGGIAGGAVGGVVGGAIGGIFERFPFDPPFWEADAALPAADGRPRRLMLREWERFYSDDIVPERIGGTTRQRRVIEERLVYADVIAL